MPELPDIVVYIERLDHLLNGAVLHRVRIINPFVLRTYAPPIAAVEGKRVQSFQRFGKQICIGLESDLFLVIHLMIAGRLHWQKAGARVSRKRGHAAFDFDMGTLVFTEASAKKRASLHLVKGRSALAAFERRGVEVMEATLAEFSGALRAENHTIKRSLTDQRIVSGVGNAYSDEILHRAQLSPVLLTSRMTDAQIKRLYDAARAVLAEWTERLRAEAGNGFLKKVMPFHDAMAVHGRYGLPCPVCGDPIQRIRYATRETNYCATCQTGGKLLADRGLSRLLGKDWPRTLEELEDRLGPGGSEPGGSGDSSQSG